MIVVGRTLLSVAFASTALYFPVRTDRSVGFHDAIEPGICLSSKNLHTALLARSAVKEDDRVPRPKRLVSRLSCAVKKYYEGRGLLAL
jgi:hypothetical protein